METMYQRGKIQEESLYYETLKHDGTLPIIGVNTYLAKEGAGDENRNAELIRSTEEEKQDQVTAVRAFLARNAEQRPAALARLQRQAATGGNVFAELMEAVKVASLGSISNALYQVGGQYRRSIGCGLRNCRSRAVGHARDAVTCHGGLRSAGRPRSTTCELAPARAAERARAPASGAVSRVRGAEPYRGGRAQTRCRSARSSPPSRAAHTARQHRVDARQRRNISTTDGGPGIGTIAPFGIERRAPRMTAGTSGTPPRAAATNAPM
jgi:hypothetical protein